MRSIFDAWREYALQRIDAVHGHAVDRCGCIVEGSPPSAGWAAFDEFDHARAGGSVRREVTLRIARESQLKLDLFESTFAAEVVGDLECGAAFDPFRLFDDPRPPAH